MSVKFDKVLLVDDDNINNFLSEEIIAGANITDEVVLLTDGQQALNYLNNLESLENQKSQKLLILLDLNMPEMDGKTCLEELKKDSRLKGIPIIIYTTSAQQTDRDETLKLGAAHFITKATSFPKMIEGIEKAIGTVSRQKRFRHG